MGWESAGEAWGARAWDWALLQEQLNSNSFDVLQQLTGVGEGVRMLDLACGSGLALQRAESRGAQCYGVDASRQLLSITAERAPTASLYCGDMAAMPYDDATFDVVTCVNGIQYGSQHVLAEIVRVLKSGGQFAMAFWSDPRDYQTYFDTIGSLSPPSPQSSTALKLSDPGVAETLLKSVGLDVVERGEHGVMGFYRTVDDACLGLASAGPAWAAIEHSGSDEVFAALRQVVEPHIDRASGRISMAATMGHLLARKP
jgi:SAM-dependent methyltransferase